MHSGMSPARGSGLNVSSGSWRGLETGWRSYRPERARRGGKCRDAQLLLSTQKLWRAPVLSPLVDAALVLTALGE
jgi:hypothetical protein